MFYNIIGVSLTTMQEYLKKKIIVCHEYFPIPKGFALRLQ